jgi:MOSC domain-containing protein YiiM
MITGGTTMSQGRVEAIYVTDTAEAPMRGVAEIRAIAGLGLEGDRYAAKKGSFSAKDKPGRQITLVEAEAIEALERELGLVLAPGETRRNVVTRGVALNHLVGRDFTVGGARLRGHELCEPCGDLARMTGKPSILAGLVHRGGLRAEILAGGLIRVGDEVNA